MTRPQAPLVFVVILHYRRADLTDLCINSLNAQQYENLRIVVVDNASQDGFADYLASRHPEIILIRNPSNAGFAGGVNAALRRIGEYKPSYAWLLNNDAAPEPDALAELVRTAESDPDVAAAGSVILEGGGVPVWGGGRVSFVSGLPKHHRSRVSPDRIDYLTGASLLLRWQALEQAGFLDERFFLYWEDTDLCFRLRAAGWKLAVSEKSKIHHRPSSSVVFRSELWDFHFTASSILFFRRHSRFPFLPILVSAAGRFARRCLQRKWAGARAVWNALFRHDFRAETAPVTDRNKPPVSILDPGNFTPGYDMNLGASLMHRGWNVEWITSRHLFETLDPPNGLRLQEAFFRGFHSIRNVRRFHPMARRIVKGAWYVADLLRLHRQIKVRPPGVLHVQWSHLPWLDAALWKSWQRRGWKIVYTAHDVRPLDGTAPGWFHRALPAVFRRADVVVVHSKSGFAALQSMGIPSNKVELLPPAPPLSSSTAPDRVEARIQLGLPPDQPVVLFFGFIKPYKGLNVLIQSFSRVRNAVNARLMIAGELMEPMRRYRRLIREFGIGEWMYWFDRYVPGPEVGACFAASDVVVLPYLDASSSGVLLSAYNYSRPVVATTVGGLPELVDDGSTGILVPPRNPEALSQALIEILGDPQRAAQMGLRGRRLLEDRYSWTILAGHLSLLYQRLWNAPDVTAEAQESLLGDPAVS